MRLLERKREHPLPTTKALGKDFTFELNRKQTCTASNHFDAYAKAHPLWGMPYGLPALSDREWAAVRDWVHDGAPYSEPPARAAWFHGCTAHCLSVTAVALLDSAPGYRALRLRFGVLRSSPDFWPHSDRLNQANHKLGPIDSGLFDYNHLDPL